MLAYIPYMDPMGMAINGWLWLVMVGYGWLLVINGDFPGHHYCN